MPNFTISSFAVIALNLWRDPFNKRYAKIQKLSTVIFCAAITSSHTIKLVGIVAALFPVEMCIYVLFTML